jgi:hypothetical protein
MLLDMLDRISFGASLARVGELVRVGATACRSEGGERASAWP